MLAQMYAQDSFFTLSAGGQLGLVLLSALLAAVAVFAIRRTAHGRAVWLRVLIGALGVWLFIWLSPQIYYQYYRLIIDGLPAQIIVGPPLPLSDFAAYLGFAYAPTLSAHSQGILGWIMIVAAVFGNSPPRRNAAN